MSGEAPTNDQGRQPTAADAAAVANAAGQAAAQAGSAAEARREVDRAVKQEAEARGIQMTAEDRQAIIDGLVNELERRGAWQDPTPPPPAAPAATEGGQPTPPPTPSPSDGQQAGAQQPDGELPPPRKKSFAEKFLGG